MSSPTGNTSRTNRAAIPGGNDRRLIVLQMWLGVGLVVFGASLIIVFHVAGLLPASGDNATMVGVATGVLGVGAAMIPATAAGAASSRILGQLSGDGTPVSVGPLTLDGSAVSAAVVTTERAVGAFVQDSDSRQILSPTVYVAPQQGIQAIALTVAAPPPSGASICVVANDAGVLIAGPVLIVP